MSDGGDKDKKPKKPRKRRTPVAGVAADRPAEASAPEKIATADTAANEAVPMAVKASLAEAVVAPVESRRPRRWR